MILRRRSGWLMLPLALLSAAALGAPQLLFLGYDLRGLIERSSVGPLSPPPDGLAYLLDGESSEGVYVTAGREDSGFKLGYEISDLVLLVTPPTLARHRL